MLTRTIASFCLIALVACGGVGDDAPGTDGGGDSADAATDAAPSADAPPSSGDVSVTIRVSGVPVPDLDVVFHNSAGEVVTSTKTDSEGKTSATVNRDAMVTVIVNGTQNLTIMGVQPLDNIVLGGPLPPSNNNVTSADVTVPSNFVGAVSYWFTNGCSSFTTGTPTTAFSLPVTEGCLAPDGSFAVIGRAADIDNNAIAWSSATAVMPAGANTSVTVSDWDANIPTIDFAFNTAPGGAERFDTAATMSVGGIPVTSSGDSAVLVPTGGASVSLPIFGAADGVVWSASVVYDDRGQFASGEMSAREESVPAVISLMGDQYTPTLDTLAIDTVDPVRVGLTWTIGGTVGDNGATISNFRWVAGVGGSRTWMMISPLSSTTATIPVLPGPLATAGPDATSTFNQTVSVTLSTTDQIPSYSEFRQNSAGLLFGADFLPRTGAYTSYSFVIADTPQ
jgi:hypothetical protein